MNMDAGPGEYMLAVIDLNDIKPDGDWVAEGGSDWRNDAGEDGGAMNGMVIEGCWFGFSLLGPSVPEGLGSGTRAAWLIFVLGF